MEAFTCAAPIASSGCQCHKDSHGHHVFGPYRLPVATCTLHVTAYPTQLRWQDAMTAAAVAGVSPGADCDVLCLLCECVGPELSHNLHRPCSTLPCELDGSGHINDDLLLSGLGLTVGTKGKHTLRKETHSGSAEATLKHVWLPAICTHAVHGYTASVDTTVLRHDTHHALMLLLLPIPDACRADAVKHRLYRPHRGHRLVCVQACYLPADGVQVQAANIADPASNVQEAEGGDLRDST